MLCKVRRPEEKNIAELPIGLADDMSLSDLKTALSYHLQVSRRRIRLSIVDQNIPLDDNYDRMRVSDLLSSPAFASRNVGICFGVDITKPTHPFDQMPSFVLANDERVMNMLIQCMSLSDGIFYAMSK